MDSSRELILSGGVLRIRGPFTQWAGSVRRARSLTPLIPSRLPSLGPQRPQMRRALASVSPAQKSFNVRPRESQSSGAQVFFHKKKKRTAVAAGGPGIPASPAGDPVPSKGDGSGGAYLSPKEDNATGGGPALTIVCHRNILATVGWI